MLTHTQCLADASLRRRLYPQSTRQRNPTGPPAARQREQPAWPGAAGDSASRWSRCRETFANTRFAHEQFQGASFQERTSESHSSVISSHVNVYWKRHLMGQAVHVQGIRKFSVLKHKVY